MKLISILKKMKGENIIIETKNNKKIIGKINKIDSEMNIYLNTTNKNDIIVVKGCNIRYIILRKDFELPGDKEIGKRSNDNVLNKEAQTERREDKKDDNEMIENNKIHKRKIELEKSKKMK
ncbi:putative small nuclear ribonucleoprotein Sm D1 [Dictyocoela muelleri]|nr:putative small nuclear ribonucleoprotein Sm D1 [Dictyocoela muelleri]